MLSRARLVQTVSRGLNEVVDSFLQLTIEQRRIHHLSSLARPSTLCPSPHPAAYCGKWWAQQQKERWTGRRREGVERAIRRKERGRFWEGLGTQKGVLGDRE